MAATRRKFLDIMVYLKVRKCDLKSTKLVFTFFVMKIVSSRKTFYHMYDAFSKENSCNFLSFFRRNIPFQIRSSNECIKYEETCDVNKISFFS